jgi:Flp pilus assembly protein TadG
VKRVFELLGDRRGSAAIEFVVAIPILVLMIWGIFQIGILYQANAGMQHALGEGARLATVWPTRTDAEIQSKITSAKFGLANGTWGTPQITTDTTAKTKTISVTYSQPTDFLFFQGPTVTLSASKVVYLAQ